jgi:His/Glu/Gln/Arg/opine family amino acid ABC transporter permease subunit
MSQELRYLLQGLPTTLLVAMGSWLLCLALGLVLAGLMQSRIRPVRWVTTLITVSARGCPELVVLFLLFFALQEYVSLSPVTAAIIAFGVVGAPFAAEVCRGALKTVNSAQRDAGLSLALNRRQLFVAVVLPQAVLFAIPPLFNLLVGMLNVSAVAGAIGVDDIFNHEQTLLTESTDSSLYIRATLLTCLIYVVMILPLRGLSALLERRVASLMAPVAALGMEGRRRPLSFLGRAGSPTVRSGQPQPAGVGRRWPGTDRSGTHGE